MGKLLTLIVLVATGMASADFFEQMDVTKHMNKLFTPRYPAPENAEVRDDIQEYIKEQFRFYGLDVEEQTFNTSVTADPKGLGSQLQVEGTNIIGIKKAVTRRTGAVIVVGADYDSTGLSDPLFYNGAGVAALLEAAHVFTFNSDWSGRFASNFTTIFVAFDINSKHYQSSTGRPGSYYFVREWLWNYIERNPHYFGGAVILDSIMNVYYEPETQSLTPNFKNLFPETYERVKGGGYKADFLAMVSMEGEDSVTLKDQFSGAFNRDRRGKRYRLEDMVTRIGSLLDPMIKLFAESANIHFWTFKDDRNISIPLPAILITDTISYRPDPKTTCSKCRPIDLVTEDRVEFVNATVKATIGFLLNRQATLLPEPPYSSTVSSLPSFVMTALMVLLVRLYI